MPGPWSPPGAGAAFFSGISQIIASVVSMRALIEEAFWIAERVTQSNHGIFTNILIGVAGAFVGAKLAEIAQVPVFGFFISPIFAQLSRRHEFQADAYACAQASGHDLAAALLKLHEDNASTLTPDPLYVRFYYSHPPAIERLAAMRAANAA